MKADDAWTPDARTIKWVTAVLHEDRISATLRAEVVERSGTGADLPDAFWSLIAAVAVAVANVTFDLVEQAEAAGTAMTPEVSADPAG